MRTLEHNTTTAQITHGGIAPVSLRSGTSQRMATFYAACKQKLAFSRCVWVISVRVFLFLRQQEVVKVRRRGYSNRLIITTQR